MLLIEADGKALFAQYGIPIPAGRVVAAGDTAQAPLGAGPWMVKAQVPVGGRGKAGGIRRCNTGGEIAAAAAAMLGTRLKGHGIDAVLVEQAAGGRECYLALMLDPASYGVRVLYAASGGVEVEQNAAIRSRLCPSDIADIAAVVGELIADEPEPVRTALADTGRKLAVMLIERELMLAEINPLFVSTSGVVAGDAKVVIDLNAIDRQPEIARIVASRPGIYADACRKIEEGFDYVELDPEGEIGLVTTGAGLSMMLIDEMTARGGKPLNFCDIRTGQFRGSPVRLMRVLSWIAARPSVKVILVNIFAGITDLGEFAGLLADAIEQSPGLKMPIVARLVGNGAAAAKAILAERMPGMAVEEDLDAALAHVAQATGKTGR
jgi:succinyl-CoA synthetase beta subunit